jgi:hypothetical protein
VIFRQALDQDTDLAAGLRSAAAWPFAFEHGNLLSEGEHLNCRIVP